MTKLKYFWVATYEDNTTHPQFNSDGTENLWGSVDQDKVIKISWSEFPRKLSKAIKAPTEWALFPRKHSLDYELKDDIFICRRNHIRFSESHGEKGRKMEYILGKNGEEILKL